MTLKQVFSVLMELNFKTVYFNFKYLPFSQAIRLPIFVSRHTYLSNARGKIVLEGPIYTRRIRIGYKVVGIFDHKKSRSIWEVSGTVVFKGSAMIGHGAKISVGAGGSLIFGSDFSLSAESTIIANQKKVEFGTGCLLSWDTLIMDTDFHQIFNETGEQINQPEDIYIGNYVWIGCRCLILKGISIPDHNIIAANSTVSKSVEGENQIFGGQPAKVLRSGITWKK